MKATVVDSNANKTIPGVLQFLTHGVQKLTAKTREGKLSPIGNSRPLNRRVFLCPYFSTGWGAHHHETTGTELETMCCPPRSALERLRELIIKPCRLTLSKISGTNQPRKFLHVYNKYMLCLLSLGIKRWPTFHLSGSPMDSLSFGQGLKHWKGKDDLDFSQVRSQPVKI